MVPWVVSVAGAASALGAIGALALAGTVGLTVAMLLGPACFLVAGAVAELIE
jgi:hypothetical protein